MKTEAARAAAMIRSLLKQKYPDVKFSVTSDNYTGGNSIRIRYTDAMPREEIENLTAEFQAGNFDGMQDLYEYNNTRDDIPQTKYLFVTRYMSAEAKEEIIHKIKTTYADCENFNEEEYQEHWRCWGSNLIYRIFMKKDYTKKEAQNAEV
jgi:hypothetical protein